MFDYLIVGAGFAGSVLAELASQSDKKILIVDIRNHIGGNAYDHYDAAGILVHKYGPHIFTPTPARSSVPLALHRVAVYEHRVLCGRSARTHPINLDTVNRLYGLNLTSFQVEEFFASHAEPKGTSAHPRMVVSKGRELYESSSVATPASNGALTHLNSTSRSPPVPTRTNRRSLFHRYISGDAPVQYGSRRCCRTQTSKSCSTLIIGRLWGYTVPGDDFGSGWWILRLPLRTTLPLVQAWDAQHACASNSCSRELSEWASIHPRHRVQIPGRSMQKLASSTSTRASRDPYYCTASRERWTLQEIQGTGWCSARREFRRAASNIQFTTWTRWWLRLWRCTAGYRLATIGICKRT